MIFVSADLNVMGASHLDCRKTEDKFTMIVTSVVDFLVLKARIVHMSARACTTHCDTFVSKHVDDTLLQTQFNLELVLV